MIWSSTQWAQVTAGAGFALLGEPWQFLPHATGKRFSSLRDFLADSGCTLAIANTYTVYLRRVHDRILLDDALAGWYTDIDIQAINRCWLYLQVECVSYICTADGLSVDPGLQTRRPAVTSQSMIKRPCQGFPDRRSWEVWCRLLLPIHTLHRPPGYAKSLAHGRVPTSGLGIRTMIYHHK
jgi:hypothetical protein